jgi:hypothetical protein
MLDDELPSERQSRSAALQTRRGGIMREGRALEMPCA